MLQEKTVNSEEDLRKIREEKKRVYQRKWNENNKERIAEYNRKYKKENANRIREYMNDFYAKNRKIKRARDKVLYAKAKGKIKPCPCVICSEKDVEAHHEDYSKPLDIIWLCKKHHCMIHGEAELERQFVLDEISKREQLEKG